MVPPILQRFPSSLLLALSLLVFVASVLLFTLPFDAPAPDDSGRVANCGPPVFEIAASDDAAPSTIVPAATTAPANTLPGLLSSTTLPPLPSTSSSTTGAPGAAGTTVAVTGTRPTPTTAGPLGLDTIKEACGAPASKRFLFGGLGLVAALVIGYLARLRRTHRFGYVVR